MFSLSGDTSSQIAKTTLDRLQITVKKFVRSEQDFNMKKSQFVSKMNGKALSVQPNGKVILVVPKPHDETSEIAISTRKITSIINQLTNCRRVAHFKVLKTGDNVFIFQSVPFPSFNVRGNPDDTLDSDEVSSEICAAY